MLFRSTLRKLNDLLKEKTRGLHFDLLKTNILVWGYQDDDKINKIHSILIEQYNNIIKKSHTKEEYLKSFIKLHNKIKKELINISSAKEVNFKYLKGLCYAETPMNKS